MKRKSPLRRSGFATKAPVNTARRISPNHPSMSKARKAVEDRSGGSCEARTPVCVGRGNQAHHRRLRSQGGSDDPGNLLWLCEPCHFQIHSHPRWARSHGLIIGNGTPRGLLVVGCSMSCDIDHGANP